MTRRIKGFALAAAIVIGAGACTSGTQNSGKEQAGTPAAAPTFENGQLTSAYRQYIQLKDALVASGKDQAAAAASALQESLQGIPEARQAVQLASAIAEAPDITAQRKAFSTLSERMATLIKSEGLSSGEVYLAFCPMANGDAGAFWLANEQEIRNPYFGEKMMKCGEVKETVR